MYTLRVSFYVCKGVSNVVCLGVVVNGVFICVSAFVFLCKLLCGIVLCSSYRICEFYVCLGFVCCLGVVVHALGVGEAGLRVRLLGGLLGDGLLGRDLLL